MKCTTHWFNVVSDRCYCYYCQFKNIFIISKSNLSCFIISYPLKGLFAKGHGSHPLVGIVESAASLFSSLSCLVPWVVCSMWAPAMIVLSCQSPGQWGYLNMNWISKIIRHKSCSWVDCHGYYMIEIWFTTTNLFCHCRFLCSTHFIWMKYHVWSFVLTSFT